MRVVKDSDRERLEAMLRERRHYEAHGMDGRLEAVDAEVARLRGGRQARPAAGDESTGPVPRRRGRRGARDAG